MDGIAIIGTGRTPVSEYWGKSLRELAGEAILQAINEANAQTIDAMYVANSYGSTFNNQTQLGALIADFVGLSGIEAYTIEAGDASGGVALHSAVMAVASGMIDTALVVGVEKATDIVASPRVAARTISLDADYEASQGATLTALAGLLMRRYMYEFGVELSAFEALSVNAHANGNRSSHAMYRNKLREGAFGKAPMVANPVSLFDSAPDGDGAATIIISRNPDAPVQITASTVATDKFMIQERDDLLSLSAVSKSVSKAFSQSNLKIDDIDFAELHDAFTILSVLSLEASGFASRGEGWRFATADTIGLTGKLPISTFGGLKSRGNPAGATGVYQAVEAYLQLMGIAGDNQVADAKTAMIQNLGGLGSTATTHILQYR